MVKNVFSLFSFTSNVDDKAIKLWPLKFSEKEEESLYIIKICHNIYKKRFFLLISHLSSLIFMYSICLIVAKINEIFSKLKFTFIFLHIFVVINILFILMLHYTHYVEKLRRWRGKLFVLHTICIFLLWCSWLFILFNDVKDYLPIVVNVNKFLYATYTHNKINIIFCFFAYVPIFYLITIIPCRICYSFTFDLLFFILRIAIFSVYYLITRRLAFHSWNKQIKQINTLKCNLKEQKEKLSLTNIEEIFNLINDVGNYYNTNEHLEEKNICVVNNLRKILTILKEDNLFSPDSKFINRKKYNHIYAYIMDVNRNKTLAENKESSKDVTEEFKEESETESLMESISEERSKTKMDEKSKMYSKNDEFNVKNEMDLNLKCDNVNLDIWNTSFLNNETLNEDIFIHIGNKLLKMYYTSNHNIPNETLYSLLYEMKNGYNNVPYHNSIHAAMVTHHCNVLVSNLNTANILRDNELGALFVASLGHDIGHFGRTNIFLKNCCNFLSIIYNDKSILENYHCSYLFNILLKDENNIFKNEDPKCLLTLRQQIIELILATDMSKHIKILAQFLADLSHNCVDWSEHYQWVKRLVNEFYYEGDELFQKGYQINPLFDRNCHNNFIQIQRTFLKELVYPLIISLKTLDNTSITQDMINNVKRNYSKWTKIEKCQIKKKKIFE
nr:phosphodiesterase gamma,putative [Plasmodium sp. DRC-Itaito]